MLVEHGEKASIKTLVIQQQLCVPAFGKWVMHRPVVVMPQTHIWCVEHQNCNAGQHSQEEH